MRRKIKESKMVEHTFCDWCGEEIKYSEFTVRSDAKKDYQSHHQCSELSLIWGFENAPKDVRKRPKETW